MSDRITPEECERNARNISPEFKGRWTRAAATIRALRGDLDAANARAEKAERDHRGLLIQFNALRAETADLLEIERCKASILEAGSVWFDASNKAQPYLRAALELMYAAAPQSLAPYQPPTVDGWRNRERWAWEHAAEDFSKRIKAAGYLLELSFGEEGMPPVRVSRPIAPGSKQSSGVYEGDFGGSPTLPALEQAAQWAEQHPARVYPPEGSATGGPWTMERDDSGMWTGGMYPANAQDDTRARHLAHLQTLRTDDLLVEALRYGAMIVDDAESPERPCRIFDGRAGHRHWVGWSATLPEAVRWVHEYIGVVMLGDKCEKCGVHVTYSFKSRDNSEPVLCIGCGADDAKPTAPEPQPCTCGHVHSGHAGCKYDDGRDYNGPCLICQQHAGSRPSSECYYQPAAPVTCPRCGRERGAK